MARRSSSPGDASTSSSSNGATGTGPLDNGAFAPREAARIRVAAITRDTRWHVEEGEVENGRLHGAHMAYSPAGSEGERFDETWDWAAVEAAGRQVLATGRLTGRDTLAKATGTVRGVTIQVRARLHRGEWVTQSIYPYTRGTIQP